MSAAIDALLVLTLLSVAAFAVAVLVLYLGYNLPRALSGLWNAFDGRLLEWEAARQATERRAQIEDQVGAHRGRGRSGREVDSRFVQAAELSQRISASFALLKSGTKTCCEIHKFTAQVHGAIEMQEIAWDPTCSNLRSYVLDCIDIILAALGSYPVVDVKILKQHAYVNAIRNICADCELLKYSVAEAPALCFPAKSFGSSTTDQQKSPETERTTQ